MSDEAKLSRQLFRLLNANKGKSAGFDTPAEVVRVDGSTAWVHIPGGVDETPVALTINAKAGDTVQVRINNGRAFLVGNGTAPPTDNEQADKAIVQAVSAAEAARTAHTMADAATKEAARAQEAADSAQTAADNAQTSANAAQQSADNAATAASNAQTSADNAQRDATTANTAANNALLGLSTVESVVDVVNWFAEHKAASTDTTVDPDKAYYTYDATTGALSRVTPTGTEDPSALGWYELGDAIADYVATHVASTNDGLSVLSIANGWRVLISSGGGNYPAGIFLIDPNGNIAQQTTVNGVEFNTGRPVKIGDQTAYISFDGNGHINVIGADLALGGANNTSGTLTVKNASGATIGTWDNSGVKAWTQAGYFQVLATGEVTIDTSDAVAIPLIIQNGDQITKFTGSYIYVSNVNSNWTSAVISCNDFYPSYAGDILLNAQSSDGMRIISSIGLNPDPAGNGGYPQIRIMGQTTDDVSWAGKNPKILFQNANGLQNLALIFTDYDSVANPASLILAGNQGGEYFIAPNIKATDRIYVGTTSDKAGKTVEVRNSIHDISLNAGYDSTASNANAGLYDHNQSKWLIRTNNSGDVYVNGVKMENSSATVTKTSVITSGDITLYRRGNMIQLYGQPTLAQTSAANTQIGTVPDGYRPPARVYFRDTDNRLYRIDADGKMYSASTQTSAGQRFLSTSYVCA